MPLRLTKGYLILCVQPVLAVMYLFNSLDKSNLGNAKTAGLADDLNINGQPYNTILSVFFVPYVLTAPFLAILGKKIGPNIVLPAMMLSFGFLTVMVVVVHNFSGMMAIRWFLGMSESAFFPLVIYYQTTYVKSLVLGVVCAVAEASIHTDFTGAGSSHDALQYSTLHRA